MVVFLHGVGGNRSNWSDQVAAVARLYRAVAWDARGYGDSEDAPGSWEFSAYADDLDRLLDHLEAGSAHIVGLSMGGRIAQEFYHRRPERVRSLTLCDTYARLALPLDRTEFMRRRRAPLVEGQQPSDIAAGVADSLLGSQASAAQRGRLIESLSALRRESYLQALDVLARHELRLEAEEIRVPTLLIFGGEDRLTPPDIGRALQARLPDSRLHVVPGAGHLVNIEQPEAFNKHLIEFLLGVSARASGSEQLD